MHLSIELPLWAWVLALLIEQAIFMFAARWVLKAIKRQTNKAIAQMRAELILREAIKARAHQLSVKAGWRKSGKSTFTTSETD